MIINKTVRKKLIFVKSYTIFMYRHCQLARLAEYLQNKTFYYAKWESFGFNFYGFIFVVNETKTRIKITQVLYEKRIQLNVL